MPVQSKSQWRLMQMLAHDPEKMKNKPKGLTSSKAQEFIDSTNSYKSLPEKKKKFSKLSKHLK
jgi:hypothetical protein